MYSSGRTTKRKTNNYCNKYDNKFSNKKTVDIVASPIRENLLHNVTFPSKQNPSFYRYIPSNKNDNSDDFHNQIITQQNNHFNFKLFSCSHNRDGRSCNFLWMCPNYNILRPADHDVENNIEKRSYYQLHTKILENEILGENISENEKFSVTPVKNINNNNILKFSVNTKSNNSCSIFEKSPTIPYTCATKDSLFTPRKKLCLPDISAYKVLDAPGIVDDFYLKLIDWSHNNILAVALDKKLYVYNYFNENVKELVDLTRYRELITSVAWSKNEPEKLLFGTSRGRIQYWDVNADKCLFQRPIHKDRIGTLDWNEHCYTTGSKDKQIQHFDIREKSTTLPIFSFNKHSHEICGLKWSHGGHMLASGGNDNKLILWSSHNSEPMVEFESHVAAVRALAWSPHDHGKLASGGGSADRTIKIWNTLTFNMIKSVTTKSQVCNLAWSDHCKRILSTHGYNDNSICIWDYPSMNVVLRLKGHSFRVLQMAMSPDGQDTVTATGDETVRFWKVFPYQSCSKKKLSSLMKSVPSLR